ncbi:hypothetical protein HII31_04708 [Pseudocercospora fuligena]|uniref:RNA recognition motif-containing protein n=1 Tax=Pseudocercospora fuligena TaxID=685502 RepID=A0A8H6RKB8_9PEZI|nr:hypothetical protein HII31_04708 [Pseudocercospora fuligena]
MPAGPGEQLLTTLFADVHYYFSDPASRPSHHRFDKSSYVYLFYNPNSYQAKLEVANAAGTTHQDAFYGYLNAASVRYNHSQPNLVTLTIDPNAVHDQTTWHLPSYDARNEQKYMYKLHTVDVYLWTEKDAGTLLRHIKSAVPADRLDVKGAPAGIGTPHSEHRDSMSPVVQQLEKTAIGTTFPPRTMSAVSAQSFPGPPTPQSEAASPRPVAAYNPAAPSAPEPVQYREKTPPPADDGTGTGLKATQSYGNAPQQMQYASAPGVYQNSAQTTPQHAYFSGPPQQAMPGPPQGVSSQQRSHSGSIPPPPAQSPPTGTSTPSFGPMAASTIGPTSPPPNQTSFNRQSSYGPGPTQFASYNPQSQYGNYQSQQGQLPPTPSAPPAYAGHTPLNSPGMPPPPPGQPYQPQQQAPVGGYSNYSYATAGAVNSNEMNQHGAYTGDIHSQVYRPTESEHGSHGKLRRAQTSQDGMQKPSPLQNSVGKAEKKVGKFLSKLDKLY